LTGVSKVGEEEEAPTESTRRKGTTAEQPQFPINTKGQGAWNDLKSHPTSLPTCHYFSCTN